MRFSLQQIFNIHDAVWCGPILRKDLKLGYVDADQLKNMYPPCDFIFGLLDGWSRSSHSNKTTWSVDEYGLGRVLDVCAWNLLILAPSFILYSHPINSGLAGWLPID